jgi:hypothetical protein
MNDFVNLGVTGEVNDIRTPQTTDIKIECSDDVPDNEIFELSENIYGISDKNWICGTDFYDHIQMIALFEIIDMEECGLIEDDDDEEYKKYPFTVQTSLMVHPKYFSQEYIRDFSGCACADTDKYTLYDALMDAYGYGGGIPVNIESVSGSKTCGADSKIIENSRGGDFRHFKTFDDAEKYIKTVYASNISAVMGLIGFYLDNRVNGIGTTGWDFIYNMTEGRDLFKPAWDRMKNMREESE